MLILLTLGAVCPAMLLAMPSLAPAYIVCLIVGGGLLMVSTVFGGDHDHDLGFDGHTDALDMHADVDVHANVDVHADVDADVDTTTAHSDIDASADAHGHDLLAISNWFSLRFLVYFAAAFGLVGTVLTYLSDIGNAWTALYAATCGLVVGQGVHQTMRALQRSSGSREIQLEDYLNQTARVTVAIHPPQRGEVAVRVYNGERFLSAAAKRADDDFKVGDRVVITGYASGTAEVVSQQEYEFLKAS